MRERLSLLAAAILVAATAGWCFPKPVQATTASQSQAQSQDQSSKSAQSNSNQAEASAKKEDPLVEAARKAREQKKSEPKAAKVFTNDDLPTQGGLSTVGQASAPPAASDKSEGQAGAKASASGNSEATWRKKFADLHQKLQQDQDALAVMQRELGVLNLQNYNDPVKAMQQQLSRDDINKKTADIEAKKKEIAADQQAITDAEADLRKSGGDPGWAR